MKIIHTHTIFDSFVADFIRCTKRSSPLFITPRDTKTLNTSEQENLRSKLTGKIETLNFGIVGFQMSTL